MKLPLSLIKSFIPLDLPAVQIGEILTLLGVEVDGIENAHPPFAKVVIGEVISVKRHPEAEKLQVAEVSDGEKLFSVVCGAPNCRAGMKSAFAKVGALLTDADGKQRTIEKALIRGVESFGMLCSGSELKISEDFEGILDLPEETRVGDDATSLLWDPVFELSLTPNLGHCMSALGIARELSAALRTPYTLPNRAQGKSSLPLKIEIKDPHLCPRYMAYLIEGVQVGPTPFWIKKQLESSGHKSVNNLVDVTNYIMLKFGQPQHVFDYDRIEGGRIEVGPAKEAFQFLGLDGTLRDVAAGALVISDARRPIALAGVMGGAETAVTKKTSRILLESAVFDPIAVRKTARQTGIRTESSHRFEKGVDPNGVSLALFEAAAMLGGQHIGFADVVKGPFREKQIAYRTSRINQILGTRFSETEVEEILGRLNIATAKGKATIPTYRRDLNEEIDLVEEVARVYGYNNIEKRVPKVTPSQIPNDPLFCFENEMRDMLAKEGLTEFLTCDLISPKLGEISREITPAAMQFLKAKYAKSDDFSVLRTSLLPSLLQVVKQNFAQKNYNIAAFEIGRIHFLQKGEPVEIPMLALLLAGERAPHHWSEKGKEVDFFDLKGIIENFIHAKFTPSSHMSLHPGRQADIFIKDLLVGSLGEVHPHFLSQFDIDRRVIYAELNLLSLLKMRQMHLKIAPLAQYPSSERDWTVSLGEREPIEPIFQAIAKAKPPFLEKVELIDLYTPPDSAKMKNATFRFTYRDPLRTIQFEEVEKEHAKLIQSVKPLAK